MSCYVLLFFKHLQIKINKKTIYLGSFDNEVDASIAYKNKVSMLKV